MRAVTPKRLWEMPVEAKSGMVKTKNDNAPPEKKPLGLYPSTEEVSGNVNKSAAESRIRTIPEMRINR
jgi:hypothetical protein